MKFAFLFLIPLVSAHSYSNGGIVNFYGYVYEAPCEYNKKGNELILNCLENGYDKIYNYNLNAESKSISSIKISKIKSYKNSSKSVTSIISYL